MATGHWTTAGRPVPDVRSSDDIYRKDTGRRRAWNAIDPIAERIRSLGHVAPGGYAAFAKLSSLPDAPTTLPKAMEMVAILAKGHEGAARTARAMFELVDKASDEPTADARVQRLTVHEQTAWMLRSLLEE